MNRTEEGFSAEYNGGRITGSDEAAVREVIAQLDAGKARERSRKERWGDPGPEAVKRLCQMLPSLRAAPGTSPWDALEFLRWVCSNGLSHGELLAARFVLGVWNATADWVEVAKENELPYPENAQRFDFFTAFGVWDEEHATALRAWAELPFWP